MEWDDRAIVLGLRPHGENGAILHVFTREHGRHPGLIKTKRYDKRMLLCTGNILRVVWRARLFDHLGSYVVTEPLDGCFNLTATDKTIVNVSQTMISHLSLLPDRDPHQKIFDSAVRILEKNRSCTTDFAVRDLVEFEVLFLAELGFGIDLRCCAVTGETENLEFVSPRTGRAVTYECGLPYAQRLLRIPDFLQSEYNPSLIPQRHEIKKGLDLTGFFLEKHVWNPRGIREPFARTSLSDMYSGMHEI